MKNHYQIKSNTSGLVKAFVLAFLIVTFQVSNLFAQIPVTVSGTAVTTPALNPTYPNLAAAVGAVNAITSFTSPGTIILTCTGGNSETAPVKGLGLGSATLNPLLSATNTITINKTGGAVTLNAGTGTAASPAASADGIFYLNGADYVTIDGLTFTDGNSASATVAMEYGIAFFKRAVGDGCNNNTIQNCIFNMQRISNGSGSGPMLDGSWAIEVLNSTAAAAITSLTPTNGGTLATNGTNSGNKFYSNTINGGNGGIGFGGYAAAVGVGPAPTATTFLGDLGNDVGGTALSTGNTIKNFGGGAATNPSAGIRANFQWSLNISYNNLNSNDGGGVNHATTLRGIYAQAGISANVTISNNTVTVKSAGTTAVLTGIDNVIGSTSASNTVNINNNIVQNCSYNTATSATFNGITSTATATSVNLNNNQILNNTIGAALTATSCTFIGIFGSGTNTTTTLNNNTVSGNEVRNNFGTFHGVRAGTATVTFNGNTVTNNGFPNNTGATSCSVYAIYDVASPTNENYINNIVTNLYVTGSGTATANQIYGIYNVTSGSSSVTASGNTISNLTYTSSSTGSATVAGIRNAYGSVINVSKNKIYGLSSTGVAPIVTGIYSGQTTITTINVFNNTIGDINAPQATGFSVYGLYAGTAGTAINYSFNTVYLTGTSSGSGFSSAALFMSGTTPSVTVSNNILVNLTTPTGAGLAVGVRRTVAALTSYGVNSNNNLIYSGTPGAANLIYYDGTNSYQTLGDLQAAVTPRETASQTQSPTFTSTTGSNINFLHINPNISSLASNGAVNISGITDDFDGDIRQGNGGYPGTGSAPDIGADEYEPVISATNDIGAELMVTPTQIGCFTSTETVVIRVRNYGPAIDFSVDPATVTCNITGATTATLNATLSGTLPLNGFVDVPLTGTFDMSANGIYTFDAFTTAVSDLTSSNNAMVTENRTRLAVTPGTLTSNNNTFCLSGTPTLNISGNANGTSQWQESTVSATGPWTNITGTNTYTPGAALTQTTYYKVETTCGGDVASSNVITVTVNNPSLVSTNSPQNLCGTGTATFNATVSSGATANWYAAASGGLPLLANSTTFTTPTISSTTDYWVSSTSGGSTYNVSKTAPEPASTGTVLSTYGQDFTVTTGFTLNNVRVYSTTGTSITISLYSSGGATQLMTTGANAVTAGTSPVINLGWYIAPGTYRLCTNGMTGNFIRDNTGVTYPFALTGIGTMNGFVSSITGSVTTSSSYYFTYDWSVSTGCETARTMVTANVSTAPTINTNTTIPVVCSGGTTNLSVNSTNDPNYTYTWNPGALNGASVNVSPATSTVYTVTATDNTAGPFAGCSTTGTVSITAQPTSATISGSPSSICSGSGSSVLSLLPATYPSGTVQWQSSTNGTTYNNLVGENGDTYTTPTLTSSTYYKALIRNSNNVTCIQPTNFMVVGVPTLSGTTDDTRCGYGQATLQATGSAGSTIKWYTAPTGGSSVGTGSPFLTPNINTTTTYYAAAETGDGATTPISTGAGATTSTTYSNPFYSLWSNLHTQHLILGSELTSYGMSAGKITSLSVNLTSAGTLPMIDLSIKIGTTAATTMASFVNSSGFTPVYSSASLMPVLGNNTINFSTPFNWDGSSNIVIEICHGNPSSGATMSRGMSMNTTGYVSSIKTHTGAGTAASVQCANTATNVLTYSTRPNYSFTFQPVCSSARTAVIATVTPSPTISVTSPNTNICPGGNTTISVSSPNDPDYTYIWSSSPAGFSASGAGPHTVSPSITTKYYVLATDNTAGPNADCAYLDSITIVNGGTLVGGSVSANIAEHCVTGTSVLTTTASGGAIQWQLSTISNSGPWTNVGTGASTYSTGALTQTTYFRTTVSCDVTTVPSSNVQTITVNNPTLASTAPAARCGYGTVTLGATPSGGASINWYTAASGGLPVATGNSYVTPNINTTTTYYAAPAFSGGGVATLGLANRVSSTTNTGYNDIGLMFDAIQPFTLQSVAMYPVGSGAATITIALKDASGTTLQSTVANVTATTTPGIKTLIPLNFAVPAGTQHRLVVTAATGLTGLIREITSGFAYPYTVAGTASITSAYTSGASASYYYYLYDWQITTGCEGIRVPVVATVNAPPAVTLSSTYPAVCGAGSTNLNVTSPNDPSYTYAWTSSPAGFTASTAGPHVVTPTATTKYYLLATDNSAGPNAGCVNLDSISVVYSSSSPTAGTVSASPDQICISGSSTLTVTGASGGAIQWQRSTVSASGPWTNVGTGATTYNAGTLTQTTYFQTETSCSGVTVTSNVQTVTVNNPQILTTTPGSRIATGTVNLGATASSGATVNWYTAASGGLPVATGTSFTTPVITTTTDYYVSASAGGGGLQYVGKPVSTTSLSAVGTYYMNFTVTAPLTIQSVKCYFSGTIGTAYILNIRDAVSLTSVFTKSGNTTVTGTATQETLVLNATLAPGNYQMGWTTDPGTHRESTGSSYPYTIPGFISITGNSFNDANYWYYFYDWAIATGCESARQQVTATVTAAALDASIALVAPINPANTGNNTVSVNITNNSASAPITSINLSYSDGTITTTQNFTGLNIAAGATQLLTFTAPYVAAGNFSFFAQINTVNGSVDASQANDVTPTVNYCVGLSGTYTINSANPTAGSNFNNLTDVAIALNCGVAGPVTFNMQSSFTEQVTIAAINGVSAVNTITFNGNGNSISFAATVSTAPHTLALNGADYLRFNNLVINGTGATYALSCHLYNGANNNQFTNCTFNAPTTGTGTTLSPFSLSGTSNTAIGTGVAGNNNIVSGCTMTGGYYGATAVSATGGEATGNQFINCNVTEYYFYGIYTSYQNGAIIRGNTCERPSRTTVSTFYGIYSGTANSNTLIEKNRVRNPFGGATASTSTAYGIYISVASTAGNENRVYNNLVSDFNYGGIQYGIYVNGYTNVYHNTVSFEDVASATASVTRGIYTASGTGSNFKNNIVSITRGGSGIKYCVYYVSNPVSSNNNNFYMGSVAGTNYIAYNGTSYSALAAWNAANPTYDGASQSADPLYNNPIANDYTPTSNVMNAIGAPLGLTDDIIGIPRDLVTPDPGAYEYANATAPPSCATNITVNSSCITNTTISWTAAAGYPSGYKLTVFDNSFNYIEYQTPIGNVLTYKLGVILPNTNYNYILEPYNAFGDAICGFDNFVSGPIQSVTPTQSIVTTYNLGAEFTTAPALPCGITKENYDGLGTSAWYTSAIAPRTGTNHLRIDKNPGNSIALDDWFFSPPINVVAGRSYRITWYDRIGSGSTAELYSTYIAPSPDATTMEGSTLIFSGSTNSTSYAQRTATDYLAVSTGQIHFGFRAESPAGASQGSLYIDDIQVLEIPVSALTPGSCGTIPSMYDRIYVQPVLGATNYRFKIVGTGGQAGYDFVHYRNNANIDYRLKWAPGVIYGYTYNVSVAYYKAGAWSPYGAACPVTLGPFPASKLRNNPATVAGPCDYVISDLNQQLFADSVSGSNDYMYKIVEDVPGGPYDYDQTWQRYSGNLDYRLVWGYQASPLVERVRFGYSYDVQVRSLVGKTGATFGSRPGEWGPYGTTCKLDLTAASPTTSLTNCGGINLGSLNDQIFATPINGATNYQYELTGPGGYFNTAYRNNGNNDFRLTWIPSSPAPGGVSFATTYSVRVRAYVGGVWLNYGTACNVTTPAAPTSTVPALCGALLGPGNFSTVYSATAVPGATQYAFRFTNVGGVPYSKIIYNYSANNTITLSRTLVCCGYQNMLPNAQYTIEVAYFAGTWSAYGAPCTFTTGATVPRYSPFNSEGTMAAAGMLNLVVYPNPASVNEQYAIELGGVTAANEQVEVRIFNMLGDKVYQTTLVTKEAATLVIKPEVQLAAGVYMAEAQLNGNVTRVKFVVK